MRKLIRRSLAEIIFFCVAFIVISVIIHSQYRLFSGALETILLNLGLHFSQWASSRRSCLMFLADLLITALIFLIARFACSIQKNSGKSRIIPLLLPVIISLVMLCILCELQVFRREDFWEVQYSRDLGLFKFMVRVLQTEGGRFFSYFLKGCSAFFTTTRGSMIYMNTCLFISLITLFAGLYRLLLLFFRTSAADTSFSEKKSAFFIAFCLFSAIVFTSPKIWEDWFWDAGGLIFGIGVSLSVLSFALILEDIVYYRDQQKVLFPSLLLFTACGCNQITTLAIDILITEALIYVLLSHQNRKIKRRVFYYFVITVAASAVCMLAPGNFYRFENGSFDAAGLSERGFLTGRLPVRLYQQISVNIIMMKDYWILLLMICFFLGSIMKLRNREKFILPAIGMLIAGFFSLLLNCAIDYMPARIYAAGFIWIALSTGLFSILAGSLFHDFAGESVLPARIRSAYVFLAVLVSFCPVFVLFHENHQLLQNIRSAWFYRDQQIRSVPADHDETRGICGVPVIETSRTDIKLAEAFIANYYGLGWVEDSGVCPPFEPFSDDPSQWR